LPPIVRKAHLKNEDMTRKKLAFFLAYTSFFFAQELAYELSQTGAYCLHLFVCCSPDGVQGAKSPAAGTNRR
jgi:hypothetical protein